MTSLAAVSEYNRDQAEAFRAVQRGLDAMSPEQREALRRSIEAYLEFRRDLDHFQRRVVESTCRETCYETRLSACCGFESIFTFFADLTVTTLVSSPGAVDSLLNLLERPNTSARCVYLGEEGCVWAVRPISCAMFLCDSVKQDVLGCTSEIEASWKGFQKREKIFTYPDKPVLFDTIESIFMELGIDSPYMYFHKSPGLLRVKSRMAKGEATAHRRGEGK